MKPSHPAIAVAALVTLVVLSPPSARGQDFIDARLRLGYPTQYDDYVVVHPGERLPLYLELSDPGHVVILELTPSHWLRVLHPYDAGPPVATARGQHLVPMVGASAGHWIAPRASGFGYLLAIAAPEAFPLKQQLLGLGYLGRWRADFHFSLRPASLNPQRTIDDLVARVGGPGAVVAVLSYYVDAPLVHDADRFAYLCTSTVAPGSVYPVSYSDGRFTYCSDAVPEDAAPPEPRDSATVDTLIIDPPPFPKFPRDVLGGPVEARHVQTSVVQVNPPPITPASRVLFGDDEADIAGQANGGFNTNEQPPVPFPTASERFERSRRGLRQPMGSPWPQAWPDPFPRTNRGGTFSEAGSRQADQGARWAIPSSRSSTRSVSRTSRASPPVRFSKPRRPN